MMSYDTLAESEIERERQNEQLAAFEDALRRLDGVDVPPSFFTELDEACALGAPPTSTFSSLLPAGIRA